MHGCKVCAARPTVCLSGLIINQTKVSHLLMQPDAPFMHVDAGLPSTAATSPCARRCQQRSAEPSKQTGDRPATSTPYGVRIHSRWLRYVACLERLLHHHAGYLLSADTADTYIHLNNACSFSKLSEIRCSLTNATIRYVRSMFLRNMTIVRADDHLHFGSRRAPR